MDSDLVGLILAWAGLTLGGLLGAVLLLGKYLEAHPRRKGGR